MAIRGGPGDEDIGVGECVGEAVEEIAAKDFGGTAAGFSEAVNGRDDDWDGKEEPHQAGGQVRVEEMCVEDVRAEVEESRGVEGVDGDAGVAEILGKRTVTQGEDGDIPIAGM